MITVLHRPIDLAAFKATGDPGPLEQTAREALQSHLIANPSHAAYVCPSRTVSATSATPAFYAAARRSQAEWCILLNRTLGCGNVRRARRAAGESTVALAYGGTLVVDGRLHLPGCWPIDHPPRSRLKRTPFQAPTVPPGFLGLEAPEGANPPELTNFGPSRF